METKKQLVYFNTADLVPYARNARTHSETQVDQIVASINEFGWTNPILVDEKNMIIAGHGRVLAAEKLKFNEVPCIVLEGLTENQKRAYVIADNQLALNAGWDAGLLKSELQEIIDEGFDASVVGFSDDELQDIIRDWESDIDDDPTKNDKENLDGLISKITITCDPSDRDEIKEKVEAVVRSYAGAAIN